MVPLRSDCPPFRVMACIFTSPDPCTMSFCDMSHKVHRLLSFRRWNRFLLTPVQQYSVVPTTVSVGRWKQKGAALHGNNTNRKNIWWITSFVPGGVCHHHYYHDDDVCTHWTGMRNTGFTLALYDEEPEMCRARYRPPGCPCSRSRAHH